MAFQFNFDPHQPHQLEGIANVLDLFDGLAKGEIAFQLVGDSEIAANLPEFADLADYWLEENLHHVQARHNERHPDAGVPGGRRLERNTGVLLDGVSNDSHSCPHLTVEMETGTGKTYVYYRTMLDLHARYGLRKFIIVVPSTAILEGVKKTFEVTKAHFTALYGVTNFALLEYDGAQPGRIGAFARSIYPTVMVITQQSFNKASNVLYKRTEKLPGARRPFEWIQGTRPIVILDEPQNMGTETAQSAIRTLKPLFVLRYSATHRKDQQPNPVYRLTPVQAFRHGLVKQIEVIGVAELGTVSANLLRLEEVLRAPLRAKVRLLVLEKGQTLEQVVTLKAGDRLRKHTGLAEHEGLEVSEIVAATDGEPARLDLTGGADGGLSISTSDEVLGSRIDIWRAQIEKTLETHFERQEALRSVGVKVLSLFFIDRVANYVEEDGIIRRLFDECFERRKRAYGAWRDVSASAVRSGYFAKTTKKDKSTKVEREVYLDEVKSDSEEAKAAFKLIMRDKETLLSFPDGKDVRKNVAFIFAHSALKEGWDNPNVFQICTLNQTTSAMKKRQEIGRGLRLCVDQKGNRPEGQNINILTVVANESYESYVRNLQTEYIEDGHTAPPSPNKPHASTAKRRDHLYQDDRFRAFWGKLCRKLRPTIDLAPDVLVSECVRRLDRVSFPEPMLTISRGRFVVVEYGLQTVSLVGPDKVQMTIETRSSEGQSLALAVEPPDRETRVVKVGDDLSKLCRNNHFRGYKVLRLGSQYGEPFIEFANEIRISVSEIHRFQQTRIDDGRVRETVVATESHPVPDLIGRAAAETHLTRATLVRILEGVSVVQRAKLFRNPEGWANTFVSEVKEALADHMARRVRYHFTDELFDDPQSPDTFFPATVSQPQKELIDGGAKSLYDRVQIDSDVERQFVEKRLGADAANLAFFFKFPPRFEIEVPRLIGKYNPDWGIVRMSPEGGYALELVRETKGSDDLTKLRFSNEVRKIEVARRYFATLGIDYRALSPAAERYWDSEHEVARGQGRVLPLFPLPAPTERGVSIPVYDLRAAAGAWSASQVPEVLGYVHLPAESARRPGLFVARIAGDSMDRIAPPGAWCLWQRLGEPGVAGAADEDRLIVGRAGSGDTDMGDFTFKRLTIRGGEQRLEPMSRNPAHVGWALDPTATQAFIARFIEVLDDVLA